MVLERVQVAAGGSYVDLTAWSQNIYYYMNIDKFENI